MKNLWTVYLSPILLIAAIALSPSFDIGHISGQGIELAAEDILLVVFGIMWLGEFFLRGKPSVGRPPLFYPILAWMGFLLATTLLNLALGNVEVDRAFFYFLKEVEFFFFYFFIFSHIETIKQGKALVNAWVVLGGINMVWIFYQLFTGWKIGGGVTYGPSAIMEPFSPFSSGGFFLLLFAVLFNVFLYYYRFLSLSKIKKILLTLAIITLPLGAIVSGSRTATLGIALAIPLSFILYSMKRKKLAVVLAAFLITSGVFYYLINSRVAFRGYHLSPAAVIKGLEGGRAFVWKDQLDEFFTHSPLYILVGMGRSVTLVYEESHSQYVRNFVETGIVGSVIFLILIGAILKKTFRAYAFGKEPLLVGAAGGFFVATVIMLFISVATEAFLSIKIDEVYWSLAAITMAVIEKKSL